MEKRRYERPARKKGIVLPPDAPQLARLLDGPYALLDFGLGGEGDSPTYYVERETKEGVAVVTLRYVGSDTIGRDRAGYVRLDARTGVLRGYSLYQGTNSPMDNSGFDNSETWTLLQVTR